MSMVKLFVKRKSSFVGAVMPYKIMINGKKKSVLKNGGECSFDIPSEQCILGVSMVGNAFTLHKISKEVVLFPDNNKSGSIFCEITTSVNWIGVFTLGIFAPVGKLQLNIIY